MNGKLVSPANRPPQRGFTLLELVMVVAIFGMVMSMAYQILSTTIAAEQRVNQMTRSGKVGQGILTQIRRDLQGAVYRGYGPNVFRGIDGGDGEDATDELHWITTSPVPAPKDELEYWTGEAASVGYVLKPAEDRTHILYRRVKWEIHDDPLEDGEYYEIYDRVMGLELRYLGEEEWEEEWDAATYFEELENENWGTFFPFRDDEEAQEALIEEGEDGEDVILPSDDLRDEEFEEIPLPLPRAVEIILHLAMGDERGLIKDADGAVVVERVSTIVPLICTEILRVEDPNELEDEEGL